MFMKKVATGLFIGFSFAGIAYSGSEDWVGTFNFIDANGNPNTVKHIPTQVNYSFFSAGHCINLEKGAVLNGVLIKESTHLCVDQNVDTFSAQVSKLGQLTNKSIQLGETYTA